MTTAEVLLNRQRDALKKADNTRFEGGPYEYRLRYDGGVAEYFSIIGRKKGTLKYHFVNGFEAYNMWSQEEVIDHAKNILRI